MPGQLPEIRLKFAAIQPMELKKSAEGTVRVGGQEDGQEDRHQDEQASNIRVGEAIRVLVCGTSTEKVGELSRFLKAFEYDAITARTPQRALEAARLHRAQIAIWLETEVTARRGAYIDAAKELRDIAPAVESILVGSPEASDYADAAFRAGVYNCMSWPVDYANLARDLVFLSMESQRRRELWLWSGAEREISFEGIVGGSPLMLAIHEQLRMLADSHEPVLVTGPVGAGKELVVCALHSLMEKTVRSAPYQPLMIFRCAGLTDEKTEELFAPGGILAAPLFETATKRDVAGGAPTSALELLGFARPGVMLIDEISDLPLVGQQKLAAWLLLNKMVNNAGQPCSHVRIVASSRCDLEALASEGKFHPGLLRLLGQQTIKVPALHERVEDIPMLVENFLVRYADEQSEDYQQPPAPELSREAQRALLRHNWPGNVRELKNAVRRAAMLAKNQIINAEDLGLAAPVNPSTSAPPTDADWQGAEGLKRPVWLN